MRRTPGHENAQPAATTLAELYVELIKSVYDKWERTIEAEPTWDAVDELMCYIYLRNQSEGPIMTNNRWLPEEGKP